MIEKKYNTWHDIIEEARWYPSPHNSQPIKIKILSDRAAEVFYDLDLGLPAENYGIPFGHVCVGVFLEALSVVAEAKGFSVSEAIDYSPLDFDSQTRLHSLGRVTLLPTAITKSATEKYRAYTQRQTSRRNYINKVVPTDITNSVAEIAKTKGLVFKIASDKTVVTTVVQVNQATLFDDLGNEPVYKEIMHWLRFSKHEARHKADGLSAETMMMPGSLLKFVMKHRNLWSMPIIGGCIRYVYLRTMRGVRQIGWLEGPFNNPKDYIEAGRIFMRVWLYFTAHNVYLHPFGTVITNPSSHSKFVATAAISESEKSMAWMLFRFGYSKVPPTAHRRSAVSMIIKENV